MRHVSLMKKEYLKQLMMMVSLITIEEVLRIITYSLRDIIGELLELMEMEVFD